MGHLTVVRRQVVNRNLEGRRSNNVEIPLAL